MRDIKSAEVDEDSFLLQLEQPARACQTAVLQERTRQIADTDVASEAFAHLCAKAATAVRNFCILV